MCQRAIVSCVPLSVAWEPVKQLHRQTGSSSRSRPGVVLLAPMTDFSRHCTAVWRLWLVQGYYRGLNSSAAPKLMFKMTGASAFPTQFAFSTYLLHGSRPSLQPCHPLAPSCSAADQEAVDNITLSGSRYITPGQRGIPPVVLPVTWGRLPPEAELRVGVRIVSISNCRVARQAGEVAAIVFGTPPGHCPPGEGTGPHVALAQAFGHAGMCNMSTFAQWVMLAAGIYVLQASWARLPTLCLLPAAGAVLATGPGDLVSNGSRSGSRAGGRNSDRPTYTEVAALQELALVLDHEADTHQDDLDRADSTDRRHLLTAPSSTGAMNSTCSDCARGVSRNKTAASSSRAAGVGAAVMPSTAAAAKAAAVLPAAASTNSSKDSRSGSSSRVLDLDPPFRPLVDRYIALLPPGSAGGHLMLSSSRWGDVTVVDTTACEGLQSARCVGWPACVPAGCPGQTRTAVACMWQARPRMRLWMDIMQLTPLVVLVLVLLLTVLLQVHCCMGPRAAAVEGILPAGWSEGALLDQGARLHTPARQQQHSCTRSAGS